MTGNEEYLLDNQQVEAGQRFDALSELFNPSTFRHAQMVGLDLRRAAQGVLHAVSR